MSGSTTNVSTSSSTATVSSLETDASIQKVPFTVNGSVVSFMTPWNVTAQISLHGNQVKWRQSRYSKAIQRTRVKETTLHLLEQKARRKADEAKQAYEKAEKAENEHTALLQQTEEVAKDLHSLIESAWILKKAVLIDEERMSIDAREDTNEGTTGEKDEVKCMATASTGTSAETGTTDMSDS